MYLDPWASMLIAALVGWTLTRVLYFLGVTIMVFDIAAGMPAGDMTVTFERVWWRAVLAALLLPPASETYEAEVRYIYPGSDSWPSFGLWVETGTSRIFVSHPMSATLRVWKWRDGGAVGLDGKPLPERFTLDVRFRRVSKSSVQKRIEIPLVID